jgi:hypothetical protein
LLLLLLLLLLVLLLKMLMLLLTSVATRVWLYYLRVAVERRLLRLEVYTLLLLL